MEVGMRCRNVMPLLCSHVIFTHCLLQSPFQSTVFLCECGLYVNDSDESADHQSRVAAWKQAEALGSFVTKQLAFPTPKQIAVTEHANAATECTNSPSVSSASVSTSSGSCSRWYTGYQSCHTGSCTGCHSNYVQKLAKKIKRKTVEELGELVHAADERCTS